MPVGPFATFGACVAAQKRDGKSDESARKICGAMERDTKKAATLLRAAADMVEPGVPVSTSTATPADGFKIAKLVDEKRQVFGFANVSIAKNGEQITDLQGHLIDPDELEAAAYEFVKLEFAGAGEMHAGDAVGQLIESFVFTPEKNLLLGLHADAVPPRWWVGFELSEASFAKVKSGEFRMFSVQGTAELSEVA